MVAIKDFWKLPVLVNIIHNIIKMLRKQDQILLMPCINVLYMLKILMDLNKYRIKSSQLGQIF